METVETVETEETVETVETEENFFCKIAHTFLYTHILYFAETHIQTKEALAGWGHSTASLHLFCVNISASLHSYFIFYVILLHCTRISYFM